MLLSHVHHLLPPRCNYNHAELLVELPQTCEVMWKKHNWCIIALVCLTGQQKTAVLLTLASIAGLSHTGSDSHHQQQYVSWLWDLLLSQTGRLLVQLDTAAVQDYVAVCKGEVV